MTMKYETLLVDQNDKILNITINRPKSLNALNNQVLDELILVTSNVDASVRCLVLRGAGEKAFVAGADIAEMKDMNADEAQAFSQKGHKMTMQLESLPQPVIACVDGFALGGGCELALASDIILATEKAKFGQPEVHLGLIPGFGGTKRLLRRVGYSKAMELLLSGRPMTGREAFESGLLARLCQDASSMETELNKIIKGISKAGAHAVAMTKSLAQNSLSESLRDGLREEAGQFATCFSNGEGREGMSAFLEKREANFS